MIHCFKQHGQVPEGLELLENARAWAEVELRQTEEADEEQDDENGYISDDSLLFETD